MLDLQAKIGSELTQDADNYLFSSDEVTPDVNFPSVLLVKEVTELDSTGTIASLGLIVRDALDKAIYTCNLAYADEMIFPLVELNFGPVTFHLVPVDADGEGLLLDIGSLDMYLINANAINTSH